MGQQAGNAVPMMLLPCLQEVSLFFWRSAAYAGWEQLLGCTGGLTRVDLTYCPLPTTLGSAVHLRHLCVEYPPDPDPCRPSQVDPIRLSAFLRSLQSLTKLQHLELVDTQLYTGVEQPEQYSTLTASTQLTQLRITEDSQQIWPRGAAQHCWPPGRQLPHLQELTLQVTYHEGAPGCIDGHELHAIITGCPKLVKLGIRDAMREGADISALLQLPASQLSIGGDAFTDAAVPVVLHLTQLKHLIWKSSDALTDKGLLKLTGLQGLTELKVEWCGISTSIWEAQHGSDEEQRLWFEAGKVGCQPRLGVCWECLLSDDWLQQQHLCVCLA